MEKEIVLNRIAPDWAASLLQGMAQLDPAGLTTVQGIANMAENGQCFAAQRGQDGAVYVLRESNGVAWVSACTGTGTGATPWSRILLPIIERQAQGCEAVAFQTARSGLVRQAQKQGYEITGWIMKKKLK